MIGMNKNELQLLPHNPLWKEDFRVEQEKLLSAITDSSLRIEHIGSTSIPTVCAKPILDIALLCTTQELQNVINGIKSLGYGYRGQFDDESNHYYAVLDEGEIRLCQLHIYTEANSDWHSKLKFRDVLSKDLKLAKEYNDYKLQLAQKVKNKSEYAEIKDKWVDEFILRVL